MPRHKFTDTYIFCGSSLRAIKNDTVLSRFFEFRNDASRPSVGRFDLRGWLFLIINLYGPVGTLRKDCTELTGQNVCFRGGGGEGVEQKGGNRAKLTTLLHVQATVAAARPTSTKRSTIFAPAIVIVGR